MYSHISRHLILHFYHFNVFIIFRFQIEVFVGDTETYVRKDPLARSYKTSEAFKKALEQILQQVGKTMGGNILVEMSGLASIQGIYCDDILGNTDVINAAGKADLIVGDSLYMCGSLIAAKFSLPYVTVFTNSLGTTTAHAFGLPLNPAYYRSSSPLSVTT